MNSAIDFTQLPAPDIILNAALAVIGTLLHFFKKVTRDGYDWKTYWTNDVLYSFGASVGLLVAVVILVHFNSESIFHYLAAGYIANSLLNKKAKVYTEEVKSVAYISPTPTPQQMDNLVVAAQEEGLIPPVTNPPEGVPEHSPTDYEDKPPKA